MQYHSRLVNIQVSCNELVYCNALRDSLYRCMQDACYERSGGHIHKRTDRGKRSSCIQDRLHDQDTTKEITNWLIKISHTGEE